MVRLNRIYTRTGDAGTTGLADGSRVSKADARMAVVGDVDEANSSIGVAVAALGGGELVEALARIQNDLFDLGADLATPGDDPQALRIVPAQVERLEREIDVMNDRLQPLRSFVLPGGSAGAAALHLARAIARRAERAGVAWGGANAPTMQYLNRLSDWLFCAARLANDDGRADILWRPGGTRELPSG